MSNELQPSISHWSDKCPDKGPKGMQMSRPLWHRDEWSVAIKTGASIRTPPSHKRSRWVAPASMSAWNNRWIKRKPLSAAKGEASRLTFPDPARGISAWTFLKTFAVNDWLIACDAWKCDVVRCVTLYLLCCFGITCAIWWCGVSWGIGKALPSSSPTPLKCLMLGFMCVSSLPGLRVFGCVTHCLTLWTI